MRFLILFLAGLSSGQFLFAQWRPSDAAPANFPPQIVQKGTGWRVSRAAVINSAGKIDAATGTLTDCVLVNGSSGPCGGGGGGGGMTDPTTTAGDLIYRSFSGTTRLAIGASGYCLQVVGGLPAWAACPVRGVFGRTGAVVAVTGDYTAAQVTNAVDSTSTYSNPAWITALASTKLTGTIPIALMPAFTGDATSTGGTVALTLATVNSNVGVCGDSSHVPQVTLNAKGLVTGCTAVAAAAGSGTVTVVGAGSLTSTAIVTGGGSQALQTPSVTATLDASGNFSTPGTVSSGVGSAAAGYVAMKQGTAPTPPANSVVFHAPSSVTSYTIVPPGASTTGFWLGTNVSNVHTLTFIASIGTGSVVRAAAFSGNTTTLATSSGTLTSGNCAKFDASGNVVDNGAVCGGSGGAVYKELPVGGANNAGTGLNSGPTWDSSATGGPGGYIGGGGNTAMTFGNTGTPYATWKVFLDKTPSTVDIKFAVTEQNGNTGNYKLDWTITCAPSAFAPTFGSATSSGAQAAPTVSTLAYVTVTGVTATSCVAGAFAYVRVQRPNSGETLAGTISLVEAVMVLN